MTDRRPPVRTGDRLAVSPERLVAGGDALARIEGFPLFVTGVFPGDRATVEIVEVKKGFARAVIVELLEAGPLRRESPCPIADTCGGCDWTPLRLDVQLRAKKEILIDTLRRTGKIDPASLPPLRLHPSPLNYRLRSRLQVREDDREIGFFELKSHRVVPLTDKCEVVGPQVIEHLPDLRELARSTEANSIETFESSDIFAAVAQEENGDVEDVSIRVGGHTYDLSTAAFFQVNRHLLPKLVERMTALAASATSRDRAVDLYAGVGFFSLPLAEKFGHVTSVEGSPVSHRYARKNLASRKNVDVVRSRVEDFVRSDRANAGVIVLDPPRAGVEHEALERIASRAETKICYLSCDPVTFARDASMLLRRGWALRTLELFDLFPNTHHIETLSSFERAQ